MDQGCVEPPTPEEAFARILRAEELGSSGAPLDELVTAVKAVHLGCAVKMISVCPGKRVFRAVRITEPPIHQSRISYPPNQVVQLPGRANEVGQSVFYASMADDPGPDARSNILACLWESRAREEDLFAIGEWQVIEELVLYPFGFQAPEMREMIRGNQSWIRESEPAEVMSLINAWESGVFTRVVNPGDESQYRMGVALTKYAFGLRAEMGETDRVSGIVYPSVPTRLNSDNICLTPEAADNGLALVGVWIVSAKNMAHLDEPEERPEGIAVGKADVTFHDSSYPCDGSGVIRWPKRMVMSSIFTDR